MDRGLPPLGGRGMTISGKRIADHLQIWVEARKRFHLSHVQIQMAREIGLNPKKLGKLAYEDQEPWKVSLPQFIERLYRKRFGRECPVEVMSIEERTKMDHRKKLAQKEKKQAGKGNPNAKRVSLSREEDR
jgi:hypothetical protein